MLAFEVGALIQLSSCSTLVSIEESGRMSETHLLVGDDPDVGTILSPVEELVDHRPHSDGVDDTGVTNGEMNRTKDYRQYRKVGEGWGTHWV